MLACSRLVLLLVTLALTPPVSAQALHWLSQPEVDVGQVINAGANWPQVSANGQYVTFTSSASNLVADDTNQLADLFIRTLGTSELRRVNLLADGTQLTDAAVSQHSAATSDGRFVAFTTSSAQLPGQLDGGNVYLKDLLTGAVSFIADYDGSNGFSASGLIHLTDDGRYLTFDTFSEIDPVHDNLRQIYRKDLQTGDFTLITQSLDGMSAASRSMVLRAVSPNGRYVVFTGRAGNLVPELTVDTLVDHTFLADLVAGTLELVTVTPGGNAASESPANSSGASVSNDGKVVYFSLFSDLVAGDSNELSDLFLYQSGVNQRLNLTPGGQQVLDAGVVGGAAINGNGTRVIYGTASAQIVPAGSNGSVQLYALELSTGVAQRISRTATAAGDGPSDSPVMPVNGQRVFFRSLASNFPGTGGIGFSYGLFGYDFASGNLNNGLQVSFNPNTMIGNILSVSSSSDQMSIVYTVSSPNLSAAAAGDTGNNLYLLNRHNNTHQLIARNAAGSAALSPSGRYVTFISATFPPAGSVDLGAGFVFLHDRQTGTYVQIAQGEEPQVNDQGRVVFHSSIDLAANDNNGFSDVYLFYPDSNELRLVSESISGQSGNAGSLRATISNGAENFRVAFQSNATDLIVNQDTSQPEVFWAAFPSGEITRVSQTPAGIGGNDWSTEPWISSNGSWIAFRSRASNLTSDDYSNASSWQALVFEIATQLHELASVNSSDLPFADSSVGSISISDSGRYVAFSGFDQGEGVPDFPGDTDNVPDAFLFDRHTDTMRLVSQFIDGSNHDGIVSVGHVVEDLTLSPSRVGVVFATNGRLTGVDNAPGYFDAFLYQRSGPPINLELVVDGLGTVSGSFGINCSTICNYAQPLGTGLTLVASPGPDASFLGWQNDFGPCNNSNNPCQLNLDRDQSLIARFSDPNDVIFGSGFE